MLIILFGGGRPSLTRKCGWDIPVLWGWMMLTRLPYKGKSLHQSQSNACQENLVTHLSWQVEACIPEGLTCLTEFISVTSNVHIPDNPWWKRLRSGLKVISLSYRYSLGRISYTQVMRLSRGKALNLFK